MRLTSSGASGGRPTGRDFHAQNRANPGRCHPITVAGWTIASVSAHRDQMREMTTQNARSMGRSRGRGWVRRRIASCWRRRRFSATRLARGWSAASSAPSAASRIVSIPARVAPVGLRVTRESPRPTRYAGRRPMQPAPAGNASQTSSSSSQAGTAVAIANQTDDIVAACHLFLHAEKAHGHRGCPRRGHRLRLRTRRGATTAPIRRRPHGRNPRGAQVACRSACADDRATRDYTAHRAACRSRLSRRGRFRAHWRDVTASDRRRDPWHVGLPGRAMRQLALDRRQPRMGPLPARRPDARQDLSL